MSDKRHRLFRHVITDHLSVNRAFPADALAHIERTIAAGERTHRGQVCFAVEGGIDRVVDPAKWQAICARMEAAFREGRYAEGAVAGIGEISALLAQHFPGAGAVANELPDKPVVL
jgi:hypothetical protein